jgi:RNA-dependent RNA polymerase
METNSWSNVSRSNFIHSCVHVKAFGDVVFQLYYPPAYEWNNMPQGLEEVPRNSRSRVSELSETHGRVAPFLCDIHITLTNFEEIDHLKKWTTLCNLPTPIPGRIPSEPINAYSHNNQRRISDWFSRLDFRVGFQLEALRRNGVLNPLQLWSLKAKIEKILKERGTEVTASILRQFNDVACRRHRISSMVDIEKELDTCIESVSKARVTVPLERLMFVHRVTQTPCAMRLAGPHLIQSNRVLRRYHAHHHLFLRVDFRDEQQLQLRWAAEVNGEKFVEERVGDILKKGFQIAGRHFDFLAYSNAALKEHSVWFVSPFEDPVDGLVDAEIIRSRLGDFTKAIECPALFGARLAQAFSATEVAVTLEPHEWDEIPDIKRGKWIHTDGVGVMSLELAERIWAVMNQHNRNPSPLPSVVSIVIYLKQLFPYTYIVSSQNWRL